MISIISTFINYIIYHYILINLLVLIAVVTYHYDFTSTVRPGPVSFVTCVYNRIM